MPKPASKLTLKVEYLPITAVKASHGNPRRHPASQIALIAASMTELGNLNPILTNEKLGVIAGHGRLEAARLAGYDRVPVIRLGHLTDDQERLYRIADNRLAELGTWSVPELIADLEMLEASDSELDLQLSGFTLDQIDGYRDGLASAGSDDPDDEFTAPMDRAATVRLGDVWTIGDHRVICGDATNVTTYRQLLDGERADMVLGDPPYNVPISGHVSGLGKHRHREFIQGTGEMSDAEFHQFLLTFMLLCARFARPGALHYLFMDWRHLRSLLMAGEVAYDELINLCVWAKSNAGMGSLYRSAHEFVAVFKKGRAAHRNNVKLGAGGRHRTNVWNYAGMTAPSRERDELLALHPTVKPVALVRDAILDVTRRGEIVLDPFGGSGTTLVGAARIGRLARLIELDPRYCDVILHRAANALKLEPLLAATGEPLAVVTARRQETASV